MSARPRPVTATINHKPQFESTPLRSDRSYSPYSTGDSTHSLISVLEHDSFDELDGENPLEKNRKAAKNYDETFDKGIDQMQISNNEIESENINEQGKQVEVVTPNSDMCRKKKKQDKNQDIKRDLHRKFAELNVNGSNASVVNNWSDVEKSSIIDQEKSLSPWEKWLIVKVKEERDRSSDLQIKRGKEQLEKEREAREKLAQAKKAEEARKEWEKEKNRKKCLEKMTKDQEEKLERDMKEEEKRHLEERAKQKYDEWLEKKREEEAKQRTADKNKKRAEKKKQLTRRAFNERAFSVWKEQAANRPKSSLSTYAYTAGKLTGYYDRTSYPSPLYYNPIPWHPVTCPSKPRKSTRRPRSEKPLKHWDITKYY